MLSGLYRDVTERKDVEIYLSLVQELQCFKHARKSVPFLLGENMHFKYFRWLAVLAVLMLAASAKADTVTVNGTYAFASNGYGIPPYGGTLNGQNQSFYCVDFSTPIWGGESWQVTITSLTGSNFSLTRQGNQLSYLEMAWLVTQMMSTTSQLQQAKDQFAIWSFSGGSNPYGTNSQLVAAALAAVQGGFLGQGFEILTPTGSLGQEFLIFVGVPEPSELVMLILGLGLLAVASRNKQTAGRQAA